MISGGAIPATVLAGYLGAGKTTLLNRLLADPGGRRIGVLVNDIGEVSIDAELIRSVADDMVTLSNGCICCTISGGFSEALEPLRRAPLDALVVECSGVADPHTVAAFLQTPGFTLDGIVVVVDASTVAAKVVDRFVGTTVARQLAAADLVILNKVDLVDSLDDALAAVERHGRGVPVVTADHADIATELVLGIGHEPAELPHVHLPEHPTDTLTWDAPLTRSQLDDTIAVLPADVVRAKGVFDLVEEPERCTVVQVVGRRVDVGPGAPWTQGQARRSVMVVIRAPRRSDDHGAASA